jgi:hypothetical protein
MASVQGRFTSVDPSRASIQLTNPQSFNRYAYAYNNPMVYIDPNGKWPTWIHHLIIDRAFPGLSNRSRNQIKRGSDYVDRFPGGQTTGSSYQHGMTAPGQPVAEAARLAEEFIQANQAEAQRQIQVGESVKGKFGGVNVCWDTTDNYICRAGDGAFSGGVKNSLYFFGMAYHTVSDMTSPAHVGFQMWRGIWIFEGTGLVLGGALAHMDKESAIDSYQLGYAIGATLDLFLNTYGPAEYARATKGLVFGSNDDPSVKAIEDKYKLPGGANPAKEAEELYLYRNGLTHGMNSRRKNR